MDFQNQADKIYIWVVKHNESVADDNCLINSYELVQWENVLKEKIILEAQDFIAVKSLNGDSTFLLFGILDPWGATIVAYKDEIKNGDFTHAAALALLTWWAYQVNNNSCP